MWYNYGNLKNDELVANILVWTGIKTTNLIVVFLLHILRTIDEKIR